MICEDYVSFETAKLLEEKGFDEYCTCFYDGELTLRFVSYSYNVYDMRNSDKYEDTDITAPTTQRAMKWLREVHKIFISIDIYSKDFEGDIRYYANIYKYGSRMILDTPIICNNYEEAVEDALKFCIKNLVK